MNFVAFCLAAREYCTAMGGSVTSWGRSEKRNAQVGGVPRSFHKTFLAVDVVYDQEPELEQRVKYANELGLKLIPEGDHDHLQPLL